MVKVGGLLSFFIDLAGLRWYTILLTKKTNLNASVSWSHYKCVAGVPDSSIHWSEHPG